MHCVLWLLLTWLMHTYVVIFAYSFSNKASPYMWNSLIDVLSYMCVVCWLFDAVCLFVWRLSDAVCLLSDVIWCHVSVFCCEIISFTSKLNYSCQYQMKWNSFFFSLNKILVSNYNFSYISLIIVDYFLRSFIRLAFIEIKQRKGIMREFYEYSINISNFYFYLFH